MASKLKLWYDHWSTVVFIGPIGPLVLLGLVGLLGMGVEYVTKNWKTSSLFGVVPMSSGIFYWLLAFLVMNWAHKRLRSVDLTANGGK